VLAGFPDDRADEGPAAGPASLLGLQIAREQGWTAPESEQAKKSTAKKSTAKKAPAKKSAAKGSTKDKNLDAQTTVGRAKSENVVEESGAETVGEDAGGTDNPKGGS
jgi:NADH-quinone oxidoreductase subunit E